MQNRNVVLSREQLLIKCWGYDYEGEARAVDTHIKRLREKLGDSASMIRTVIKTGYVLEV
jgi:DNA-binding response OmpR family regulator